MELQTSTTFDNGGNNRRPSDPDTIMPLPHSINGDSTNASEASLIFEDIDSGCSTPYVSAPSSPGFRPFGGFFYSAPASPMHFSVAKGSTSSLQCSSMENHLLSFEFEFSARFGSNGFGSTASMSSADELFLNGKIRPMKLSTHLERPQILAPLMDLEVEEEGEDETSDFVELGFVRGRDLRLRDTSLRRRTRSMSPLRNAPMQWPANDDGDQNVEEKRGVEKSERENKNEEMFNTSEVNTPSVSASSSRSSSAGRNSKRWVFLKDFLYRSKSEGRSTANHKFWSTISFSPVKEKKPTNQTLTGSSMSEKVKRSEKLPAKKLVNGVGKRRVPQSPHELHYTANRAQAEEMRKKTFLPYRQGLLGCLGFSSKGYGAINGFARALNPVSSRGLPRWSLFNYDTSELEKPGDDETEESQYDMGDGT